MIYLSTNTHSMLPNYDLKTITKQFTTILMVRSTLKDIYLTTDKLSATYNQISYTCIYLTIYD
ncbi:hypothetical protein JCM17380_26720 [Desulfosporosinus burensis]